MTISVEAATGHHPRVIDLATGGAVAGRSGFSPVIEHESGHHVLGGPWTRHRRHRRARPAMLVKHGIWTVSVGRDTDVEVEVIHHHPRWFDRFAQIGPLGWVTPFTDDDRRLGLGPVDDLSLGGAGYLLHGFRSPADEILLVEHYRTLLAADADAERYDPRADRWRSKGRRTRSVLRARGDRFDVVWNGRTPIKGLRRPRWTRGVDRWGIHVIDISPRPGGPGWSWEPGPEGRPGLHDYDNPHRDEPEPLRFDLSVRCL